MKVTRKMIRDAERIEQEEMELLCSEKRNDGGKGWLRTMRRLRQPSGRWSGQPSYRTRD